MRFRKDLFKKKVVHIILLQAGISLGHYALYFKFLIRKIHQAVYKSQEENSLSLTLYLVRALQILFR